MQDLRIGVRCLQGSSANYQPIKIWTSLRRWQNTFAGLLEIPQDARRVNRWVKGWIWLLDLNSLPFRRVLQWRPGMIALTFAVFECQEKTHRLKGWRKLSLLYQGEDQRCQVSAFRTELGSLIQNLSISDDGTWESTETTWGQGFRAINQSIVNIIKILLKAQYM